MYIPKGIYTCGDQYVAPLNNEVFFSQMHRGPRTRGLSKPNGYKSIRWHPSEKCIALLETDALRFINHDWYRYRIATPTNHFHAGFAHKVWGVYGQSPQWYLAELLRRDLVVEIRHDAPLNVPRQTYLMSRQVFSELREWELTEVLRCRFPIVRRPERIRLPQTPLKPFFPADNWEPVE